MKNIAVLVILFCFGFFVAPSFAQIATQEVSIIARNFEYLPNQIVVRKDQPVRIYLTSVDNPHGFALGDFKIKREVDPGTVTVIDFVPNKTGEFPFHCSVFCGWGHVGMKGKLFVVE